MLSYELDPIYQCHLLERGLNLSLFFSLYFIRKTNLKKTNFTVWLQAIGHPQYLGLGLTPKYNNDLFISSNILFTYT